MGVVTWWMKQQQLKGPPPSLQRLGRQVAQIQKPLNAACQNAALLASSPPTDAKARANVVAQLRQARAVALQCESAFRGLTVPPELAGVSALKPALAAKVRMATLSAQVMDAAIRYVEGDAAAGEEMRALQQQANAAAEEAASHLKKAMATSRAAPAG